MHCVKKINLEWESILLFIQYKEIRLTISLLKIFEKYCIMFYRFLSEGLLDL
jgi:hypothetical protein